MLSSTMCRETFTIQNIDFFSAQNSYCKQTAREQLLIILVC